MRYGSPAAVPPQASLGAWPARYHVASSCSRRSSEASSCSVTVLMRHQNVCCFVLLFWLFCDCTAGTQLLPPLAAKQWRGWPAGAHHTPGRSCGAPLAWPPSPSPGARAAHAAACCSSSTPTSVHAARLGACGCGGCPSGTGICCSGRQWRGPGIRSLGLHQPDLGARYMAIPHGPRKTERAGCFRPPPARAGGGWCCARSPPRRCCRGRGQGRRGVSQARAGAAVLRAHKGRSAGAERAAARRWPPGSHTVLRAAAGPRQRSTGATRRRLTSACKHRQPGSCRRPCSPRCRQPPSSSSTAGGGGGHKQEGSDPEGARTLPAAAGAGWTCDSPLGAWRRTMRLLLGAGSCPGCAIARQARQAGSVSPNWIAPMQLKRWCVMPIGWRGVQHPLGSGLPLQKAAAGFLAPPASAGCPRCGRGGTSPAPLLLPAAAAAAVGAPQPAGSPTPTLPQKWQKYLECWLTSIFLMTLRRLAP
jgi:hypothetical protein